MYSSELNDARIKALEQLIEDNLRLLEGSVYHKLEICHALESVASKRRIAYAQALTQPGSESQSKKLL